MSALCQQVLLLAAVAAASAKMFQPALDTDWPCAPVGLGAVVAGKSMRLWPVQQFTARRTCSPLDFGGVGDNATDDTAAVQQAVDACSTILFPTGRSFAISQVQLNHSNLHLRFARNASLVVHPPPLDPGARGYASGGLIMWCSGCIYERSEEHTLNSSHSQ